MTPPTSPLDEPPSDPRVLTRAERRLVTRIRARRTWYRDDEATQDVRSLLELLDRVTTSPTVAARLGELDGVRASLGVQLDDATDPVVRTLVRVALNSLDEITDYLAEREDEEPP